MSLYKNFIRPLLFSLDPEHANRLADFFMKRKHLWRLLALYSQVEYPELRTKIAGIDLLNPIGVAAGFDKNCELLSPLLELGFGYVVGGTVLLHPQPGKPKPRLIRDTNGMSLINSMGFPSKGSEFIIKRLKNRSDRNRPLVLSVAGSTVDEYVNCFRLVEPFADAIELNISSPNTADLRVFQEVEPLRQLLGRINYGSRKPVFLKIPPYGSEEEKQRILELVSLARTFGIDGITATNTRRILDNRLKVGLGGVSGKAIYYDMLRIVKDVRKEVGDNVIINASGGIFTSDDVVEAFRSGADTVQIYTALIYEGFNVVKNIKRGIREYLQSQGVKNVADIKGAVP